LTDHAPQSISEPATTYIEASAHLRAMVWYGTAAAALLTLLLWLILTPSKWNWLAPDHVDIQIDGVDYRVNESQWNQAIERSIATLPATAQAAMRSLDAEIDHRVAETFSLPRANVKNVADWYYSIPGQVARLGLGHSSDVIAAIRRRTFPEEEWAPAEAKLVAKLTQSAESHFASASENFRSTLHAELAEFRIDSTLSDESLKLSFQSNDNALLVRLKNDPALARQGIAVSSSALSSLSARRAAQAAAARGAARTGSAKASVACASTGPMAWVCAGGVFAATLLASEYTIFRLDEVQNRDDFESVLDSEIGRIEKQFKETLRDAIVGALSKQFVEQHSEIDMLVRPIDRIFAKSSKTRPRDET
jgi:hypothetical protein